MHFSKQLLYWKIVLQLPNTMKVVNGRCLVSENSHHKKEEHRPHARVFLSFRIYLPDGVLLAVDGCQGHQKISKEQEEREDSPQGGDLWSLIVVWASGQLMTRKKKPPNGVIQKRQIYRKCTRNHFFCQNVEFLSLNSKKNSNFMLLTRKP